jgi:meso-butanediol dehydrogenase/(S,S)-butanediol dehydrogenase/diacetyl reductase
MNDQTNSQRFHSKVVIVTGAGSGIGEGAARRFAAEGASVVLAGRTRDKLERVARDLDPSRTLVHPRDVSSDEDAELLISGTVARFGRIDVRVNNAGVAPTGRIDESSLNDWRAIMSTDLDGVFYCSRAAIRYLIEARGAIVNVSSVSGLGGDWGMSFYNAA